MMDSTAFKRFKASMGIILENIEGVDLAATGKH